MMAHVAEHQAHMARMQIEQMSGVPLPPPPDYDVTNRNKDDGYEIDPEMERQVAAMQAQAATQIAAMQQAQAQQAKQQQAQADPQFQLAQAQLALEGQKVQAKAADSQAKNQLRAQEIENQMLDQERDRKLKASEIRIDAELEREKIQQSAVTAAINRGYGSGSNKSD
jgi:hypothetical protein